MRISRLNRRANASVVISRGALILLLLQQGRGSLFERPPPAVLILPLGAEDTAGSQR
jgi:hypothetical protein